MEPFAILQAHKLGAIYIMEMLINAWVQMDSNA